MERFVEGANRSQPTLLPECLDDWVGEDNAVHVIDTFVDALHLEQMGIEDVVAKETGRPSYHPSILLSLYIYSAFYLVPVLVGLHPPDAATK